MAARAVTIAAALLSFVLGASLGTVAPHDASRAAAGRDCTDVVARAFVRPQPGSGAWACLTADKRAELSAAGIDDDASLAQAARATRHDYEAVEAIGAMPQVGHPPIRVFMLTRSVATHELVGKELRPVTEHESVLLLISPDETGKVEEFGFVGADDNGGGA